MKQCSAITALWLATIAFQPCSSCSPGGFEGSPYGESTEDDMSLLQMHVAGASVKADADTEGVRAESLTWGNGVAEYKVEYEKGYFDHCLSEWQTNCREKYSTEEDRKLFCENFLDRDHLKGRLLVPKDDVQALLNVDAMGRNATIYKAVHGLQHFTPDGTKKLVAPAHLHQEVQDWVRANRFQSVPENPPVAGVWCNNAYDNDDYVLPTSNLNAVKDLSEWVRGQLEQWTGQSLAENAIMYGTRMYHRGSICAMHTDEKSTHVISAIYHVDDRDLQEPWPLNIIDHSGREQSITSKPGDIILYESATIPHGRAKPLNGTEYSNIFFHFKPKDWSYQGFNRVEFSPTAPQGQPGAALLDLRKGRQLKHSNEQCLPWATEPLVTAAVGSGVMYPPSDLGEFPP